MRWKSVSDQGEWHVLRPRVGKDLVSSRICKETSVAGGCGQRIWEVGAGEKQGMAALLKR